LIFVNNSRKKAAPKGGLFVLHFSVRQGLEEETFQLQAVCNALDGYEECCAAHLHVVLLCIVPYPLEVVLHDRYEAVVVLFLGPEESGEVLYPFKV